MSRQNDENDKWRLEVYKGFGLGNRGGIFTVEGGGKLDARNLDFRAHRCEVDVDGWINLDRQGFSAGREFSDGCSFTFIMHTFHTCLIIRNMSLRIMRMKLGKN